MKKNSKLRYVGLCAAALLLVAPVAAPAISAASNVSVVSAATTKATDDQIKNIGYYFDNVLSSTKSAEKTLPFAAADFTDTAVTDVKVDNVLKTLVKDGVANTADLSGVVFKVGVQRSGQVVYGQEAQQVVNDLVAAGSGSITVSVKAYLADDEAFKTVLGEKTSTVTLKAGETETDELATSLNITIPSLPNAVIGDSTVAYNQYATTLDGVAIVADNGHKENPALAITGVPENVGLDALSDSATKKFTKVGTFTQTSTYKVALDAKDANGKAIYGKLDLAKVKVNGQLGASTTSGQLFYDNSKGYKVEVSVADTSATITVVRTVTVGAAVEVPTEEKVSGVVSINYVPGYGIQVWDTYKEGRKIVKANGKAKKLAHGTSWKVFKKITIGGQTWYNLGGDQWVNSDYAKFAAK